MAAGTEAHEHRIVVGVDGSVPSKAALTWAVGQAELTGAVVEAVIAWEFPAEPFYSYTPVDVDVDLKKMASNAVADTIAQVTAGTSGTASIRSKVVEGNAAQALVDAAAGADLLVVGNRGHGGFVEALLGSTGQRCVQHATCPVVVIRDSVTGTQR